MGKAVGGEVRSFSEKEHSLLKDHQEEFDFLWRMIIFIGGSAGGEVVFWVKNN